MFFSNYEIIEMRVDGGAYDVINYTIKTKHGKIVYVQKDTCPDEHAISITEDWSNDFKIYDICMDGFSDKKRFTELKKYIKSIESGE